MVPVDFAAVVFAPVETDFFTAVDFAAPALEADVLEDAADFFEAVDFWAAAFDTDDDFFAEEFFSADLVAVFPEVVFVVFAAVVFAAVFLDVSVSLFEFCFVAIIHCSFCTCSHIFYITIL